MPNPIDQSAVAASLFGAAFGGAPAVIASAPGRVNLIGEHTDYNGGEVLPIAIGQRTAVALRPNGTDEWRAVSATADTRGRFARGGGRTGGWWDYPAGVAWALGEAGIAVPPCDLAVASDVPAGAGLSSSAALEVATALALATVVGRAEPLDRLALLSQRAENAFVGVQSGIMDQFASALGQPGRALHVWCDSARFEQIPMDDAVLIVDTAVPRSLLGTAFNTRRAECEVALAGLRRVEPGLPHLAAATPALLAAAALPEPFASRARHVVDEVARVHSVVDALRAGDPPPGDVLLASHESLRVLYDCSSPELDWVVGHAMTHPGVRGARLTGAGWGGCAIAVGEESALAAAAPRLAHDYEARFGHAPRTWLTRAATGARIDEGLAGPPQA